MFAELDESMRENMALRDESKMDVKGKKTHPHPIEVWRSVIYFQRLLYSKPMDKHLEFWTILRDMLLIFD